MYNSNPMNSQRWGRLANDGQPQQQPAAAPAAPLPPYNAAAGNFDWLKQGQNPQWQDMFSRFLDNSLYRGSRDPKLSNSALNTGYAASLGLGGASPFLSAMAYPTLGGILQSQGQTDPRAFNAQISSIQRGGQVNQDASRGELARLGPGAQQSGMGQALQAAIGQGTQQQDARARSTEAQTAEQRKRDDLGLFMQMVMNPSIDFGALGLGQYNANAQRQSQESAANQGFFGSLINAAASYYGGRRGGS